MDDDPKIHLVTIAFNVGVFGYLAITDQDINLMNDSSHILNIFLNYLSNLRHDQTFWIMLSAIGTLLVAAVAVWKENFHREPLLVLEAENLEGSAVPLQHQDGSMVMSCYYHLRVRNQKTKVLVKNARVLFRSIRFETPPNLRELHPPRPLVWAPAELGEAAPSFLRERTVDLIRVLRNYAEVVLQGSPFSGEHIIQWGQDARIILEVVADNYSRETFYELACAWQNSSPLTNFEQEPIGNLRITLQRVQSQFGIADEQV